MASESVGAIWPRRTLRDAKVILIDCDHRTPPAVKEGYPYVTIPQLKNGRIELEDARRISHGSYVEWTRKAKPSGFDVVLSRRCNPGETAFVAPGTEFALGQNLVLLRADGSEVYPPYLRWLVRGPEWWNQIKSFLNVGAVFDSLRCADIPKFSLCIPPIEEQMAIAKLLGALDDRIELLKEANKSLEKIARAIFKSWFVDFDPVRAKAEGREPEGMDAATAAFFPSEFEDSKLGPIPRGWTAGTVSDCVTFHNSKRVPLSSAERSQMQGPFPYYGAAGPIDFVDNFLFDGEYVLVGEDGSVISPGGKPVLQHVWGQFWVSNHAHVLQPRGGWSISSLRNLLSGVEIGPYVTGAVQPKLSMTNLKRVPVVLPPQHLLQRYAVVVDEFVGRERLNSETIAILSQLRDTLLPRLISGKLRVPEAEKLVEAVL